MSTQIVAKPENAVAVADEWTRERIETLKSTYCKGATDAELELFIEACRRTRLDPFARQIYAIKRWDAKERREVMVPQTSVDGFRAVAQRTGEYDGQDTLWCDETGKWFDVWLPTKPPAAAKVTVYKKGSQRGTSAVALFREYVQTTKDGKPTSMWQKMPANQLAKCAESLALRKAFPNDLSGIYTKEEMGQADHGEDDHPSEEPASVVIPPKASKPTNDKKAEAQIIEAEVTSSAAVEEARNYVVTFGKFRTKRLGDIPLDELKSYMDYILNKANMENGGTVSGVALQFMQAAEKLVGMDKADEVEIPF